MNKIYRGWVFTKHPIWDSKYISCELGNQGGENINWLYCRGISINLRVVSPSGVILENEFEIATVVFDENKIYTKIMCS